MGKSTTINGLEEIDLLGRRFLGCDVATAIQISRSGSPLPLNDFDISALEAGIRFLESVDRGKRQIDNPQKYCASIKDCNNYRDFREYTGYAQVLKDIRDGKVVSDNEALKVLKAFQKLKRDADRMYEELEEVEREGE